MFLFRKSNTSPTFLDFFSFDFPVYSIGLRGGFKGDGRTGNEVRNIDLRGGGVRFCYYLRHAGIFHAHCLDNFAFVKMKQDITNMKTITTMGTKAAYSGSYLGAIAGTKSEWVKTVNYTKLYRIGKTVCGYMGNLFGGLGRRAAKVLGAISVKFMGSLRAFWVKSIMGNFSYLTPEQTAAAEEAALRKKSLRVELWIFLGLSVAALAETFYMALS